MIRLSHGLMWCQRDSPRLHDVSVISKPRVLIVLFIVLLLFEAVD